jgi:energy-converting hydrogenase Eha subunit F
MTVRMVSNVQLAEREAREMRLHKIQLSVLFGILVLLGPRISPAHATDGWLTTFDTEGSLDGWEITHGNFTWENGALVGSENCYSPNQYFCGNALWRNSTAITGTWSFDILQPENLEKLSIIYYVGISVTPDGFHPEQGYTLVLFESKIQINYRYSNDDRGPLDVYEPAEGLDDWGWMHFDITRDEAGHINAYLNGTHILAGTDTYFTYSEAINIQVEPGARLDNIAYSSSIDPPTSPPSATTEDSPSWTSVVSILSLATLLVFRKRMIPPRQK